MALRISEWNACEGSPAIVPAVKMNQLIPLNRTSNNEMDRIRRICRTKRGSSAEIRRDALPKGVERKQRGAEQRKHREKMDKTGTR